MMTFKNDYNYHCIGMWTSIAKTVSSATEKRSLVLFFGDAEVRIIAFIICFDIIIKGFLNVLYLGT